jgi:hypothetical protein
MSNNIIKLQAPAGVTGVVQASGTQQTYQIGADGGVTVDPFDVTALLRAGFTYVANNFGWYDTLKGVAAASVALLVASAALSNGTKSVAAQVDVPRQAQAVIIPGTLAITAGTLTLTYIANDGTVVADVLSLVTALSTNLTLTTSKGVVHLTSAVVAGLVGGASPTFQVGTNATLALPLRPGFQDVAVVKENTDGTDGTVGTVTASGGLIAPTTAPNATHVYSFGYTYVGV